MEKHIVITSLKYLLLIISLSGLLSQDFGTISGKVFDKNYGDPVIGAYVMIAGMSIGTSTDLDGKFSFQTPTGNYELKIEYVGYNTVTLKQIHVEKDKNQIFNIALSESINASDVVVVEAKIFKNSETGLLIAQKKSEKMFDAISSEQISKNGDSNLGDVLKRVTGVTIVGGKNVFVRGVGERYSNVQLNGSSLPSTNPDKKEFPMNIFSSSIVDNIIVQKAYTADQPGEFSGGSVQIKTKEFPEQQILKLTYSTGVNDRYLGDKYISSSDASSGWLGFGNSGRSLPSNLINKRAGELTQSESKSVVNSLAKKWNPSSSSILPNQGVSFVYGDNFELENDQAIGVISSLQFRQSNSSRSKKTEDVISKRSSVSEGRFSGNLTGMLNIFFKI